MNPLVCTSGSVQEAGDLCHVTKCAFARQVPLLVLLRIALLSPLSYRAPLRDTRHSTDDEESIVLKHLYR